MVSEFEQLIEKARVFEEEYESFLQQQKRDQKFYYVINLDDFVAFLKKQSDKHRENIKKLYNYDETEFHKYYRKFYEFNNLSLKHTNLHDFFEKLPNLPYRLVSRVQFSECNFVNLNIQRIRPEFMGAFVLTFDSCNIERLSISYKLNFKPQAIVCYSCSIKNLEFNGANNYEEIQSDLYFDMRTEISDIFCKRSVMFSGLFFDHCKLVNSINFNNAKFSTTTSFLNIDFYVSPKFHGAELHSDTKFLNCIFRDIESPNAVGDYRVLKKSLQDIGAEQDSLMFHALEMDARRNIILPKLSDRKHNEWIATLSSYFLKYFNDYGRNFWAPLLILTTLLFLFSSVYYISGTECNNFYKERSESWMKFYCNNKPPENAILQPSPFRSMLFSTSHSFGPLGLVLDNKLIVSSNAVTKLLSFIQIFLSSVIWYLYIVQIRRQFKL